MSFLGSKTVDARAAGHSLADCEDEIGMFVPVVQMTVGRKVTVVFFEEHNAREAVVVAVYT
jgi:hypothetical protein